MGKDLTSSAIERQNILNNNYALEEIQKAAEIKGVIFQDQIYLTKDQIARFFEVDVRTIERYISDYSEELRHNGYEIIKGDKLKQFKMNIAAQGVSDINVGDKTNSVSIFNFRSFLNIGMLLSDNERARLLRQLILDIVIDTVNKRTGGGTKYINQRDEDFITASYREENYRKQFTDALRDCVEMGNFKYPLYTDKIYVSIFREKTEEYRKILKLHEKDKVRDTMYSEVLDIIASYECGFADVLQKEFLKLGRKLSNFEVDGLFEVFEGQALWKPMIEKARSKMASRDLAFRDALHIQLEEYIKPISAEDFERFLGEKSKELSERLEEAKDVFKRLKERE